MVEPSIGQPHHAVLNFGSGSGVPNHWWFNRPITLLQGREGDFEPLTGPNFAKESDPPSEKQSALLSSAWLIGDPGDCRGLLGQVADTSEVPVERVFL